MRVAVLPARNEAVDLAALVSEIRRRVDQIVVVDDASEDMTAHLASRLGCVLLRNEDHRGYGATLHKGLLWCRASGASIVITIDADGQHEAEWIDRGPLVLREGADVVFANRFGATAGVPVTKQLSNNFAWHCVKQCTERRPVCEDVSCGFRIYNQQALQTVLETPLKPSVGYAFTQATLAKLHGTQLALGAFRVPAIYPKSVIGTEIGELRDFLSWLLECPSSRNEATGWLDSLDHNLPLVCAIEHWRTGEMMHMVGRQVGAFVQFTTANDEIAGDR